MNVFEDLLGALKEENLLEETVIKTKRNVDNNAESKEFDCNLDFLNVVDKNKPVGKGQNNFTNDIVDSSPLNIPEYTEEIIALGDVSTISDEKSEKLENKESTKTVSRKPVVEPEKPVIDEKEFYRKRAMEEVSGLQMVEHILTGVEREQNKTATAIHNDIAVKKALHDFLQVSEDVKSAEHAEAEFQLLQETQAWCSALSQRDKRISVAHLRRYCETTKPPLSSQALISLARFYRNLPYTESVRSKYDLVVTRLFSKDIGGDKRVMVFTREELIKHTAELYAEWSSIPLYAVVEDESKTVSIALKFEEFIAEAERAESFDELINSDFFNRLRLFKTSTDEVFFAPLIMATTIESNIRIGNKYVDLIEIEREKSSPDSLREKYDFLNEQAISDSTSKTLQLINLLNEKENKENKESKPVELKLKKTVKKAVPEKIAPAVKSAKTVNEIKTENKPNRTETEKKSKNQLFAVNKWLLSAAVITTLLSFGLYFWVNYGADEPNLSTNVKNVNLENSTVKNYVTTARISGDTFYGVTAPTWDSLSLEKKEELIKKIFTFGAQKGYSKVHLLNSEGKAVGYATPEKAEVMSP